MAKNCGKQTPPKSNAAPRPQAYYRLHTLLHTVRAIAQHEDDLCCLLHELDHTPELTPELSREVETLLSQLSATNFQSDLNAVWHALSIIPPQPATEAKPTSTKAKKKAVRIKNAQTKKAHVAAVNGKQPESLERYISHLDRQERTLAS